MTTQPSATTVEREPAGEIPDVEYLRAPHREELIADMLSEAAGHDRELVRVGRAVDVRLGGTTYEGAFGRFPSSSTVIAPSRITDSFGMQQDRAVRLAVLLYPAAAKLVDQALEFARAWEWNEWPAAKREEVVRGLFVGAGIGEHFMDARDER